MMRLFIIALVLCVVSGCANQPVRSQNLFQIGSATSKNLFVDSAQFSNRTLKLRLRNSSGDPDLDIGRLRQSIESGLKSAGYEVSDKNFGIVMDVNVFQFRSSAASNVSTNTGLGALLGGVVGYEATRRSSEIGAVSGSILGAVAGAALEDIVRNHGSRSTYLALCDVGIGVVRAESKKGDSFVIGGNRIEREQDDEKSAYSGFAMKDTVRVAVYAGDDSERTFSTIGAIVDRLGRVIANLL